MNSLLELLEQKAETLPHHVFLTMKGMTYTFSEVRTKSAHIGQSLREIGFAQGDRIAILSENRPEWGVALFSIFSCGAAAVPIDSKLTTDEIMYILRHSGSRGIFCSRGLFHHVREAGPDLRIFLLDADNEQEHIEQLEKKGSLNKEGDSAADHGEEIAFIVYTSGTTGRPKGVMLTHRNILANLEMVYRIFRKHFEGGRFLSILPLNHTFEITGGFFTPLIHNATICYVENLQKETVISAMRAFRPTVMLTVPAFLNFLHRGYEEKMKNLPSPARVLLAATSRISALVRKSGIHLERYFYYPLHRSFGGALKLLISGAAPLNPHLLQKFDEMGFSVLEGYGLTECSPIISVNTPEAKRPGSVGRPFSGISIKIAEVAGTGTGEILVSGPSVMKGYYEAPDETSGVLRDGWLSTGDVGSLDGDGFLFISGRLKDVIVSQTGKKIFPEEIEEALMSSPYIRELCVLGKKKPFGEDVYAVIVVNEESLGREGIKREDWNDFFHRELEERSRRLSAYKRVHEFLLTDRELPRTTTLKIKRADVAHLVEANLLPAIGRESVREAVDTDDPVFLRLRTLMSTKLNISPARVMPATSLYDDLGIDSLMRLDMFLEIERQFGVPMADETILAFRTAGEVAKHLKEPPAESASEIQIPDITPMLKKSPLKDLLRTLFHLFYRVFAGLWLKLSISGRDNIPPPPFIVAPNHASLLDVPLILCAFPLRELGNIYTPAAADFFSSNRVLVSLSDLFLNIFPFFRKSNYLKSLRTSIEILRQGRSIILFPEGFLSMDGKLQELRTGIAHIAAESGAPIVPVYIRGAFEVMPSGKYLPKPGRIAITIGRAFVVDESLKKDTPGETYLAILKKLETCIVTLMEEQSGEK